MLGALLDGSVEARDLFLTVIDLAVRGYLQLRPLAGADQSAEPYDWAVSRTDKPARGLRDFEATLLDTPVSAGKDGPTATLSSMVNDAQDALTKALSELRGAVARAGWFTGPGVAQQKKASWSAGGGVLMLLGLVAAVVALVAGIASSPWPGLAGAALMVVSGVVLISLTHMRPTMTAVGDQTRGEVQRYRTWLQELQPHDVAADKADELFETNIVPSFAFGLQQQFATVFDTAVARYRNWGGSMAVATTWLDAPAGTLVQRVTLLDQLLDDATKLTRRAGFDEAS